MKKSRFTEEQIVFALKQAELGTPVPEVCRKLGISDATFYTWRKKYGGISPSELKHMRQLEEENLRLKKLVLAHADPQTFARVEIDYRQQAKPATVKQRIGDKIHPPYMIGIQPLRLWLTFQRRFIAAGAFQPQR